MDQIDKLDKIADSLESMGNKKLASQIDVVSNTLEKEARLKSRNRPYPVFDAKDFRVRDNKDHYPINTLSKARKALEKVHGFDKSPKWFKGDLAELRTSVARAVKFKYPSIKIPTKSKD